MIRFSARPKNSGYELDCGVLRAARFGVPQKRVRLVYVGVRKGLPPFPVEERIRPTHADSTKRVNGLEPQVTLWEAIGDLPRLAAGKGAKRPNRKRLESHRLRYGDRYLDKVLRVSECRELTTHVARPHNDRDLGDFGKLREGENSGQAEKRGEKMDFPYSRESFRDRYTRQHRNRLASTIVAHMSRDGLMFIHPTQLRSFTPREAARLQSFPDDFHFSGGPHPPVSVDWQRGSAVVGSRRRAGGGEISVGAAMTGEEIIPSPRRLMESLRGLGYSFPAAVADLVDNSIEARATQICVNVCPDGMHSRVVIADNGRGIPVGEMREVMRYGTEREYNESDLGKFGLGLKTASMSQCRRVEVFSRTSRDRAVLHGLAWDLDRVERTNRWEVSRIPVDKMDVEARDFLRKSHGTVVIWRKLDRVSNFDNPHGKRTENAMFALCRDLENHLAMVFHRFIDGDEKRGVEFLLNGNRLDAWDPFVRSEPATQQLAFGDHPPSWRESHT